MVVRKVSEKDPMMTPGVESEEDAWEAGMVNCPWSGGGGGCQLREKGSRNDVWLDWEWEPEKPHRPEGLAQKQVCS